MDTYIELKHFKFWCQKILPLVYDDSLSYYEVLCKVVDYINKLIDDDKIIVKNIDELQKDMTIVKRWIDNFDTGFIEKEVNAYLKKAVKMVMFGLNDNGYFVAYIPETWDDIIFNTTGLDITIDDVDYGHLVLSWK